MFIIQENKDELTLKCADLISKTLGRALVSLSLMKT